jgi:hypothetical protein
VHFLNLLTNFRLIELHLEGLIFPVSNKFLFDLR